MSRVCGLWRYSIGPMSRVPLYYPTIAQRMNMLRYNKGQFSRRFTASALANQYQLGNAGFHSRQSKGHQFLRSGLFATLSKTLAVLIAVPLGYSLIFFAYDATTYVDGPLGQSVTVPVDALVLKSGGPKNLPIASSFVDDVQLGQDKDRPRLVILGSGWGANAILKNLDKDIYNVTVISPTNHFLITPLLPSAAVGTMRLTSLVEPIRQTCAKLNARFLEGAALDVDFDSRLIEVSSHDSDGRESHFYVPYDKVVIAAGAKANSHGVPGLEHCYQFKSAIDVLELRQALNRRFEAAALPTTTDEERKKLLSFVVCGGGPTGVELAAEIFDLLKEDLAHNYPHVLVNHASVHIIQSRSNILCTYDESIAKYAMAKFMKDGIALHMDSRVDEITEDKVFFTRNEPDGSKSKLELPYGICMWTTGIALTRLTQKLISRLGDAQHNRHAIETDAQLRVIGAPLGEVYAIGDCASVRTDLASDLMFLVERDIKASSPDSLNLESPNTRIRADRILPLLHEVAQREPQASQHIRLLTQRLNRRYNGGEELSLQEIQKHMQEIDRKIVSLPATAQRAHQQGLYLAKKFNHLIGHAPLQIPSDRHSAAVDTELYPAFSYKHYGQLAYIPNEALFDIPGFHWLNGIFAMYLWRGVYFSGGPSNRTRLQMVFDWLSRGLFGRDMVLFDRVNK